MTINDIINYRQLPKYNTARKCSDIQKAYIVIHQVKKQVLTDLYNECKISINQLLKREYKSFNDYVIKNRRAV